MTVERIRDAVIAGGRAEAAEIAARAQAEHDRRMEDARRSIEEEFRRRFEDARQHAEQESVRAVLHRRAEHNMMLLEKRNAILDDLFRKAAARVAAMPDDEYLRLVGRWMAQVPADAAGEVLCAQRDAGRLAPLVRALNASRKPGAQLCLTPAERPQVGGVIFRAEKFEVDLSLDSKLVALREELAPRIADMVFPPDVSV